VAPHIMGILFYFGIFYLAALAQWMVLKRITKEINQLLPDGEQYTTSMWAFSPRSARSPINEPTSPWDRLQRLARRNFVQAG
jgi:hypothetical protein